MHWNRPGLVPVLLGAILAIGTSAGVANAANYDWTVARCRSGGCVWSDASAWSPAGGPPGNGDFATISKNVYVSLTGNIASLTGLTLQNGAALHTNGHGIAVENGPANTFLFGTGTTGGNTRLVVDSGVYLGLDFIGHFLSFHQGAELRMQGGGAILTFGFNLSQSSLISGHGLVALLNAGTRFDVAGTIRPEGGLLTLASYAASRLDLDGNVAGTEFGHIDATSTGDLLVEGTLTDPFSGVMEIGNTNIVEFDTALVTDGDLIFKSGIGSALVAPSIVFGNGATVTVDGGVGHIETTTDWPQNVAIDLVATSDELHLIGNSSFGDTTTATGDGLLVNDISATMTVEDGTGLDVGLANDGLFVIGQGAGVALVGDYIQNLSGVLDIQIGGIAPGSQFDRLHVTGDAVFDGGLDITFIDGFTITSGQPQFFEFIDVDGTSTGHFEDLPEGGTFGVYAGVPLRITYFGGDGNDVVLYAPEPGLATSLMVGVLGLFRARRR